MSMTVRYWRDAASLTAEAVALLRVLSHHDLIALPAVRESPQGVEVESGQPWTPTTKGRRRRVQSPQTMMLTCQEMRRALEDTVLAIHSAGWACGLSLETPLGLRHDGSPILLHPERFHPDAVARERTRDLQWIDHVLADADATTLREVTVFGNNAPGGLGRQSGDGTTASIQHAERAEVSWAFPTANIDHTVCHQPDARQEPDGRQEPGAAQNHDEEPNACEQGEEYRPLAGLLSPVSSPDTPHRRSKQPQPEPPELFDAEQWRASVRTPAESPRSPARRGGAPHVMTGRAIGVPLLLVTALVVTALLCLGGAIYGFSRAPQAPSGITSSLHDAPGFSGSAVAAATPAIPHDRLESTRFAQELVEGRRRYLLGESSVPAAKPGSELYRKDELLRQELSTRDVVRWDITIHDAIFTPGREDTAELLMTATESDITIRNPDGSEVTQAGAGRIQWRIELEMQESRWVIVAVNPEFGTK